jgi:prepilin-type processing-associated H-X9-DG protein
MTEIDWRFQGDEFDDRGGGDAAYADSPWWWQRYHFGNTDALMKCPSTRVRKLRTGSTVGFADEPWQVKPLVKSKRLEPYVGSYAQNFYLLPRLETVYLERGIDVTHLAYRTDGEVQLPSATPVFADSVHWGTIPLERDAPARDLFTGGAGSVGMENLTIARHGGSGTARKPLRKAKGESLRPYQSNIAFMDGHTGAVPLENLWQFHWHNGWKAPSQRPP